MANYKPDLSCQNKFIPIDFSRQILPGTFEFALSHIVDNRLDLSGFDAWYNNDKRGAAAYPPTVMLKIILLGYAHGLVSSRRIAQACETNITFMSLSGDVQPHYTSIASFVSKMSEQIAPLFTQYSLGYVGWEQTLKYFMYFILFGLLTSIFLLSKKEEEFSKINIKKQNFSEAIKEAFSHKGYILLVAGFFVCGFQITLVATHVPGYMQDRGLGGWTATIILALIGLFNIVGTLGIGYLGTKYSKKILLSILYSLRAIIIAIFIFSPPSIYMSVFFGITFGLLWLSTVPPTNGIVAQIFGTKYLSTLFGIVFLSHQVGSFIGAYLGGYFYDLHGSYDYAWYMAIALSIFATIVHFPIDEQPIKRELKYS